MTFVLLTGAGFTRNWGGWLGDEAFEYLLGCGELDGETRTLLWADRNVGRGFEATLEKLQDLAKRDATGTQQMRLEALTTAIAGMFNLMDQGLQVQEFVFQKSHLDIRRFLAHFDVIATLNQDLFLERKYFPYITQSDNSKRWASGESPGVAPPASGQYHDANLEVGARRQPMERENFTIFPHVQPYLKLHGSSNWFDADGRRMLVVGGGKAAAIGASPLLAWYANTFRGLLHRPGARLMVIGYGFADEHINQVIQEACQAGLQIFIIDPTGANVIDKRPKAPLSGPIPPFMEAVQDKLIGASRRSLAEIFGSDQVEWQKVMKFFER